MVLENFNKQFPTPRGMLMQFFGPWYSLVHINPFNLLIHALTFNLLIHALTHPRPHQHIVACLLQRGNFDISPKWSKIGNFQKDT